MLNDNKVKNRIKDGMLLGTIYDQLMLRLRYSDEKTASLYKVMVGQKHRMLFYRKFKKKYLEKCTTQRLWESKDKISNKDTVWVMWLQGIDNAPEIVKRCVESQVQALPEKKFIFLDESSIEKYIKLPEYIYEKRKKGFIGNAHYSDLVRNEILINYGGYWIDSTVYITDNSLFKNIDDLPLFMFSFYYFGFNPEIMELNNWLIHSCTNNNMISLLQKMLLEYWKDYDRAVNYFIYQIFETIVNEYYCDEYKKIPIVSQAPAHLLATYIYDEFDKKKYDFLLQTSGIHKLSTRFDMDKLGEGSFYNVIVNNMGKESGCIK